MLIPDVYRVAQFLLFYFFSFILGTWPNPSTIHLFLNLSISRSVLRVVGRGASTPADKSLKFKRGRLYVVVTTLTVVAVSSGENLELPAPRWTPPEQEGETFQINSSSIPCTVLLHYYHDRITQPQDFISIGFLSFVVRNRSPV